MKKKKEKLKATRIQKSFDMALVQIIEAWEPVHAQKRR